MSCEAVKHMEGQILAQGKLSILTIEKKKGGGGGLIMIIMTQFKYLNLKSAKK